MALVKDHSGCLFSGRKCSLKDVIHNSDAAWQSILSLSCGVDGSSDLLGHHKVVFAVMKGHHTGRQSAYIIAQAILQLYEDKKLLPRGLHRNMECVQSWSLRKGEAVKELAA